MSEPKDPAPSSPLPSEEGTQAVAVESKEPENDRPPLPELVSINELHARPAAELLQLAVELNLRLNGRGKHQLIHQLASFYVRNDVRVEAEGLLDLQKENFGYLRYPEFSLKPLPDDIYVHTSLVREFGLRYGSRLKVVLRKPRNRDKFIPAETVLEIEGSAVEGHAPSRPFEKLTALFPDQRLILENRAVPTIAPRLVDLVAPLGMGQRGLIAAPPRGGKTILLKEIARSLHENYPEVELIVLLLDERPEEVTDFQEAVDAQVFSSTFDESPKRHIQLAELVSERAKRLVEQKKDVVLLLDSLTRLARGFNALQGGKGGTMSGGIHRKALEKPRRFFGSARNVEEGGSLTILATALIETESKMDQVIFEEFKGTGNMELHLDREFAEQRMFPAIHLPKSGTRNDDRLYHPDEFQRITLLRKQLAQLPPIEALEKISHKIANTTSNAEILMGGTR
ncbi:MAG: transcription termination factor Rho [Verrucomicrobiota bacterium]